MGDFLPVDRDLATVRRRLLSGEAVVAGVLSGTSMDGIDVALMRFPVGSATTGDNSAGWRGTGLHSPRMFAFETVPFESELAVRLRALVDGAPTPLGEVACLHRDLGRAFGAAVDRMASAAGAVVDLVGSHGQTVFHHDGTEPSGAATLQLGDGDFVSEVAGAPVVSDFRQRDVAAGGEGAPLTAFVEDWLFEAVELPGAVLNLGGIANLTWWDGDGRLVAFDPGPVGSLLDGLARRLFDRPFDRGGELAARGRADPALLARMLSHPYIGRRPPKSTGRDTFGAAWVESWLATGVSGHDLLATAVAFVARAIARGLELGVPSRPSGLVLAGGGVHHIPLVAEIERQTGIPVCSSQEWGVDPDAREALAFGALAAAWVLGRRFGGAATGSGAERLLGKLSPAPVGRPDA